MFAPTFLAQVRPAVAALTAQLVTAYGALQPDPSVTATGSFTGEMVLRFAKAQAAAQLVLSPDAPHLVTGLVITKVAPVGDSAVALAKDLAAMPGTVNAYFAPLDGGTPVVAVGATGGLRLAQRSSFMCSPHFSARSPQANTSGAMSSPSRQSLIPAVSRRTGRGGPR